jgi:thiosulfate/3-mercaptopyruvate sulfurtransferase
MNSLIQNDGKMKSVTEIKEAFINAGVNLEKPVIFTCGGGVMATFLQLLAVEAGCT